MTKVSKKLLSVLLCGAMGASMIACGSSTTATADSKTETAEATTEVAADSTDDGEIHTVKVCFPSLLYTPSAEGTQATEDALNEYLESIGENIRIELEAMVATNYVNDMNLKLTGSSDSDAVDLYIPLSGIAPAAAQEQIIPLDQYLGNELSGAESVIGDYMDAGRIDGQLYGVPCWKEYGLNIYYFYRADIAEELGFTEDKIKTMDDVEQLLLAVKEAYPDMYGLVPTGGSANAGNTLMLDNILAGPEHYSVDKFTSGVGVIGDDMTVQNIYASDYFKDVCETAYEWNQEGLIMADASITSDLGRDLVQAGRAFSVITGYGSTGQYADMGKTYSEQLGQDIKAVTLDTYLVTSSNCMPQWSVAYKAKEPAAACKLLSYFYTDEFIINTLLNGVEGVNYVKNDDGTISFPEGVDESSSSYYAFISCGIVGSMEIQWAWDTPQEGGKTVSEANAESTKSNAFGFSVKSEDFADEAAAITNIENQYLYGLICGELNPDEYLPKFNEALEGAGIDIIIDEVQGQLDEFLANK